MNQSKSQLIKLKTKFANLSIENPLFPFSYKNASSTLFINNVSSQNNSNINSGFSSTATNYTKIKELYHNINLFKKRQFLFNKSIEENNRVFKYKNCILFEKKNATTRNKKDPRIKKIESSESIDYSKFFLTDSETLLPILNTKNMSNEIIEQIRNSNRSIEKTKNKNDFFDKTNYTNKKRPLAKLIKNNIKAKLNIFKNEKKKSLLPSVFIADLRYYLIQKKNLMSKREKSKRFEENENEKIEYLDYKINTLEKNYSLFNNVFKNKLHIYLREINKIKQYEKDKDNILISQLINLKNDVNLLEVKLEKIQLNKSSFNHWKYLQICLKEKKLQLPESYKIILESKNDDENILIEKFGKKLVKHVMQYKNILLYKDANEFLNQFTIYENKNFALLNKYFILKEEIRILEHERDQIKEIDEKEKNENILNDIIKVEMKELNKLKNENISLEKYIKSLINSRTETKIKDDNLIKINKIIYDKTITILQNINTHDYNPLINSKIKSPYQSFSEKQMILNNLSKIEIFVDLLIKKNKLYKELYSEKMHAIKNELDKEKKYINNIEKIKIMKQKYEEKRKKLIEKNNKIIILPKHKVNIEYRRNRKISNQLLSSVVFSKRKNKSLEDINDYFNEY